MLSSAASTRATRVKQVVGWTLQSDSATSSTRNRRGFHWRVDSWSSRRCKSATSCASICWRPASMQIHSGRPKCGLTSSRSVEKKRTNKGQQASRRHLNLLFYSAHQNLHLFTGNLLQTQANTYIRLHSLDKTEAVSSKSCFLLSNFKQTSKLCLTKGFIEICFVWKRMYVRVADSPWGLTKNVCSSIDNLAVGNLAIDNTILRNRGAPMHPSSSIKQQRGHGRREAMCNTWRCFVRLIPLIVSHETLFLSTI